jgi:hypothetical protein
MVLVNLLAVAEPAASLSVMNFGIVRVTTDSEVITSYSKEVMTDACGAA